MTTNHRQSFFVKTLNLIQQVIQRFITADFRKLLGDSSWTYASTAVTVGLQFAETIIIARFLTVDLYGVFVLITSYPEVVLQFLDFRAREAMIKYLTEFLVRNEKTRAVALVKLLWLLDVGTGLLAFLIVVITATLASHWLNLDKSAVPLIIFYSLGLLFASLDSASGSILRVYDRFAWAFWLGLVGNLTRFTLILAAVFWGQSLEAIVWARASAELVMTGLLGSTSLLLLRRDLWAHRHSGLGVLRDRMREITGFVFHTNFAATFKGAASKLDVLILGFFWPASVVGIYKMATKFAGMLLLISDPLSVAILPNFARQYATKGFRELIRLAWPISLIMLPIAVLGFLILGGAAGSVISLTVGVSFLPAVDPLRIMLPGILLAIVFVWVRPTLLVIGRADVLNLIGLATSGLQLGILWIFVSKWGVLAGAVGVSAQFGLYVIAESIFLWWIYRRTLGKPM